MSTFGAVAFDVTHSHTKLDKDTAYGKGSLDGNSFRVSYSKDFDQLNSRVTFAGYRFSEENFMTMSEYLDASDSEMVRTGNDKEMYTATYNQNFRDAGVSVYLNYTRHTYWDREEQTNYNIMLSHYFNMGSIRNMSVSLTGYRYEYDNRADKGM
ncbi:export usher protein [Escherichia coli]|nr:export usher protein [Escherichia coli]